MRRGLWTGQPETGPGGTAQEQLMKCVLHIGTEKTATTLLQRWVYDNEAALSAQGVALSRVMDFPNNRKLVSFAQGGLDDYLKMRGVHDAEARAAFFEGFARQLADEIYEKARDHDTFLITSEHFHSRLLGPAQVARVREVLEPYFDEFRVICYFREQSQKRTSLYSTGLRVSTGQTITEFQNAAGPKTHAYNYLTFFRKWEDAFGKEALVPRLFAKGALTGGDIRRDFLAHALPNVAAEALSFETATANEALSADEAALFQKINAARPQFIGKTLDPTPGVVKHMVEGLDFLDRSEGIYDPRQEAMYEAFNASNIAFFERYFGEARNLFERPKAQGQDGLDAPKYSASDLAQFAERLMVLKNLVVVREEEVTLLADLANRLHSAGTISAAEAIALLSLAQRARPGGEAIAQKIEELWSRE
ncbi:MAG: hypothetical protein AAFY25_01350 [Pseudomonadota bacterium]